MSVTLFSALSEDMRKKQKEFENFHFRKPEDLTPEKVEEEEDLYGSIPKGWLFDLEEGEIIAQILLHKRLRSFEGEQVTLGGLGGVCVHKEKRGQGLGTHMLKESVKVLRDWKCDVAVLCTDIRSLGNFYSTVGFIALPTPYIYTTIYSNRQHTEKEGMIAPICSEEAFSRIVKSRKPLDIGVGGW